MAGMGGNEYEGMGKEIMMQFQMLKEQNPEMSDEDIMDLLAEMGSPQAEGMTAVGVDPMAGQAVDTMAEDIKREGLMEQAMDSDAYREMELTDADNDRINDHMSGYSNDPDERERRREQLMEDAIKDKIKRMSLEELEAFVGGTPAASSGMSYDDALGGATGGGVIEPPANMTNNIAATSDASDANMEDPLNQRLMEMAGEPWTAAELAELKKMTPEQIEMVFQNVEKYDFMEHPFNGVIEMEE